MLLFFIIASSIYIAEFGETNSDLLVQCT